MLDETVIFLAMTKDEDMLDEIVIFLAMTKDENMLDVDGDGDGVTRGQQSQRTCISFAQRLSWPSFLFIAASTVGIFVAVLVGYGRG